MLRVQAEESGGKRVESHTFQGVGKVGLNAQGYKSLLRGIQALVSFGVHNQLQAGVSAYCGGAKRERGHQEAEAGFGVAGPEAELVVGFVQMAARVGH
jgi:hypothetical protein